MVNTLHLHCRGLGFDSLVREVRSCMSCDVAKKNMIKTFFLSLFLIPLFFRHMGLVAPQRVGSSRIGDQIGVSCIGRQILCHWATREALINTFYKNFCFVCFSRQNKSKSEISNMVRSSTITVSDKAHILSMQKFGLRDTIVKSHLIQKEEDYTYIQNFR